MAGRRRKVANTVADPTLNTTQIAIKGKEYTLCFDMGALAEAELHFRRAGEQVNLLSAFAFSEAPPISSVLILFPCAIRKFHPELSFKEAQAIIGNNLPGIYAVAVLIARAWQESMPEADPDAPKIENPPLP